MKDYKELYTEDVNCAKVYRQGYLESVMSVALKEAEKKSAKRERYISPEKLKENRKKYLCDFKKLIGEPLFDRTVKNDIEKTYVGIDGQGYINRIVFNFEKGIKFSGLLFTPFDTKEDIPLIVAIHGGDGTPELMSDIYGENYYSHITRRLLDRNVAVFCPQLLIWDSKKYGSKFDRYEIDAKYKALGSSRTAFECECIMGAIDGLSDFKGIDKARIGITGLSYGAYYSLVTAAIDERIKAVYSSCVFNDRIKYSRPDFVYTGMSNKFLDAETAALISPRALYIEAGKNDCIFSVTGVLSEYRRLEKYYSENKDKLVLKLTETGHKYSDGDEGIDFLLSNI